MKIVLLTTQALHHSYFLMELEKAFPIEAVIVETKALEPPFETYHPFEDQRENYEADKWFNGRHPCLAEFAQTREFSSVNEGAAISTLSGIRPDVVVVFGTGKLSPEVIETCPREGVINLHGGDPECYRGLDSHLWSIYHNDFNGLVTTLHIVNNKLDDGDIVLQNSLKVQSGMGIHMLRVVNTEACLKMTLSALDMYERFGSFNTRKQSRVGRYYSFMPRILKEICKHRFEKCSCKL